MVKDVSQPAAEQSANSGNYGKLNPDLPTSEFFLTECFENVRTGTEQEAFDRGQRGYNWVQCADGIIYIVLLSICLILLSFLLYFQYK